MDREISSRIRYFKLELENKNKEELLNFSEGPNVLFRQDVNTMIYEEYSLINTIDLVRIVYELAPKEEKDALKVAGKNLYELRLSLYSNEMSVGKLRDYFDKIEIDRWTKHEFN